eukprot:817757-Prorocentrum_minimum.AAC.4
MGYLQRELYVEPAHILQGQDFHSASVSAKQLKDQQRAKAIAVCVDPPTYNIQKLKKKYLVRPFAISVLPAKQIAGRSLEIGVSLGGFGSAVLADKLTGNLEKNLGMRAKQFREKLTLLGPTFIKGKWHSDVYRWCTSIESAVVTLSLAEQWSWNAVCVETPTCKF